MLYGINVAKPGGWPRSVRTTENINTVQYIALSQENAPQTYRIIRQIERSSGWCQIFGVCQGTSSYSNRTAHLYTVHGTPSSCYDMKPQTSLDQRIQQTSVQLTIWSVGWYKTAIRDIDDLKQCLTCDWAELKQSVVDKAIEQWRPRLRACIRAKGPHFEQLLNRTFHFLVQH